MTGIIWYVQVVHYPLFARVPADAFPEFHARHSRWTGMVVAPLMIVELLTAIWITARPPGGGTEGWMPVIALALLAVVWFSTFFVQVPCHRRLGAGYDEATVRRLVRTNWIRTLGWSARSICIVWMLAGL